MRELASRIRVPTGSPHDEVMEQIAAELELSGASKPPSGTSSLPAPLQQQKDNRSCVDRSLEIVEMRSNNHTHLIALSKPSSSLVAPEVALPGPSQNPYPNLPSNSLPNLVELPAPERNSNAEPADRRRYVLPPLPSRPPQGTVLSDIYRYGMRCHSVPAPPKFAAPPQLGVRPPSAPGVISRVPHTFIPVPAPQPQTTGPILAPIPVPHSDIPWLNAEALSHAHRRQSLAWNGSPSAPFVPSGVLVCSSEPALDRANPDWQDVRVRRDVLSEPTLYNGIYSPFSLARC